MCGFLGIGGKSFYENKIEEITKAFNWLKHRGPDESKTKLIGDFFIGFHRLSIVGINNKKASQPILTPKKKLNIMFNGEIYNYKSIAKEKLYRDSEIADLIDSSEYLTSW